MQTNTYQIRKLMLETDVHKSRNVLGWVDVLNAKYKGLRLYVVIHLGAFTLVSISMTDRNDIAR